MSSLKDAAKLAKDAKKVLDAVREARAAKKKRLEQDAAELKLLRRTAQQLADLLAELPTRGERAEAIALLSAAVDLIGAQLADPEVQKDDLRLLKLVGSRGALRQALGLLQLRDVFDTRELLPLSEVESIARNVAAAQQVIAERTALADFVRIGFMVADLVIKVAMGVAKAVA
ncbi:MAG: hypothetical protein JNM84_05155 [Planctomycetes bacterium]|nr:hypothetical protein [Planctomycetota bacterium]